MAFRLIFAPSFQRDYKRIVKKNHNLKEKLDTVFKILKNNPFDGRLGTHLIKGHSVFKVRSSRVTGDLRVLWYFDLKEEKLIVAFDFGGHSGSRSVYK